LRAAGSPARISARPIRANSRAGRSPGFGISAIAKPDEIRFAEALPKTRSGKIMRRLLKEIASGKTVTGDTTTLEDFSVLAKLSEEE